MSMIRTHIAEISQKIGETITIKGHAQTIREACFLFRGPSRLMP